MSEESRQPKDWWDKLHVIGGPLIALVGLIFTISYNTAQNDEQEARLAEQSELDKQRTAVQQSQLKLQRLDALVKFYPELVHEDGSRRRRAIELIKNSDDEQLATRLAVLFDDREAVEKLFTDPSQDAGVAAPTTATEPAIFDAAQTSRASGWAYLGTFDSLEKKWITRYFAFEDDVLPASLVGTRQVVGSRTGALNVRSGMPTLAGEFPHVVGTLRAGAPARIVAVRPWLNSDYQWARIEYNVR